MSTRDLLVAGAIVVALSVAGARTLAPPAATVRQLSVEAIEIADAGIGTGEARRDEARWSPPDDVFVVGWAPWLGAPDSGAQLFLQDGATTLFQIVRPADAGARPVFAPSGTGFLVRKGQALTLRLQVTNSGAPGRTHGARALIYFHPVAWR